MKNVIVIAEAGVNHNGQLSLAKELIKVAKNCGADYVKFQTFKSSSMTTAKSEKAEYQIRNTMKAETQQQMLQRLEFSKEDFIELKKYCDECKIGFLSSAFDLESIDILHEFNMDYWKIPSGEITNLPYLRRIALENKPVIISTGMATIEEIEGCVAIFKHAGHKLDQMTVLQCTSNYPSDFEELNLLAMNTMGEKLNLKVGFSDHSPGIEASTAAVALGATVIEKHFTLDKSMDGPDHRASLSPSELKSLIDSVRNIQLALGSSVKKPTLSEEKTKLVARKSIVANSDIKKGEVFSVKNLTTKRPGTGVSPMKWDEVLGSKAVRDFSCDELIEL